MLAKILLIKIYLILKVYVLVVTNPINPYNVGFITLNLKFLETKAHLLDEQNYIRQVAEMC